MDLYIVQHCYFLPSFDTNAYILCCYVMHIFYVMCRSFLRWAGWLPNWWTHTSRKLGWPRQGPIYTQAHGCCGMTFSNTGQRLLQEDVPEAFGLLNHHRSFWVIRIVQNQGKKWTRRRAKRRHSSQMKRKLLVWCLVGSILSPPVQAYSSCRCCNSAIRHM